MKFGDFLLQERHKVLSDLEKHKEITAIKFPNLNLSGYDRVKKLIEKDKQFVKDMLKLYKKRKKGIV